MQLIKYFSHYLIVGPLPKKIDITENNDITGISEYSGVISKNFSSTVISTQYRYANQNTL